MTTTADHIDKAREHIQKASEGHKSLDVDAVNHHLLVATRALVEARKHLAGLVPEVRP